MNVKNRILTAAAASALAVLLAGPARAAAEEHDDARRLAAEGAILPLEKVIERARAERPGRIIETELEREGERYVYQLEVLDEAGAVSELRFDAGTGELLGRSPGEADQRGGEDREHREDD